MELRRTKFFRDRGIRRGLAPLAPLFGEKSLVNLLGAARISFILFDEKSRKNLAKNGKDSNGKQSNTTPNAVAAVGN
jgi:hypothetical protein